MTDQAHVLQAVSTCLQRFERVDDGNAVFDGILDDLVGAVGASGGVAGLVHEGAGDRPRFEVVAATDAALLESAVAVPPRLRPDLQAKVAAYLQTGPRDVDFTVCSPKPEKGWCLFFPLVVDGELAGLVGVMDAALQVDTPHEASAARARLAPVLLATTVLLQAHLTERKRKESEHGLRRAEARSRAILENAVDGIITIDERGTIDGVNPAASRLFGYAPDEMVGRNVKMLMPDSHAHNHDQYIRSYLQTGHARIIGKGRNVEGLRKDGSTFPMSLGVAHARVEGRGFFTGIIRDISKEREGHQALSDLNRELQRRVHALDELLAATDLMAEMSRFMQACRTEGEAYCVLAQHAETLLPESLGMYFEASGGPATEPVARWGEMPLVQGFATHDCWAMRLGRPHISRPDGGALRCPHLDDVPEGVQWSVCVPVQTRAGTVGLLSVHFVDSLEADQVRGEYSRIRRVSSLSDRLGQALTNIHLQRKMEEQSLRDPLTKLFNRRHFEQVLAWEVRRSSRTGAPVSLLVIDVDHFKRFNDDYGHQIGDEALIHVAELLRGSVRDEDCVCRYGGEEFVVVLPTADAESARRRAEVIRSAVAGAPMALPTGGHVSVTISIGVACFPVHGASAQLLFRQSDAALYAAKEAGRNRVSVSPSVVVDVARSAS